MGLRDYLAILMISTKLLMVSTQEYCTDPEYIPSNGARKPSDFLPKYMDGAVLRYSCDDTYMLVPNIEVQICTSSIWVPPEHPECQEICDGLEYVPSSYHVPLLEEYPVGSIVTYTCHEDTVLIGEPTRTCLPDRTWTGTPPRCQPASHPTVDHTYCLRPPWLENGVILCCYGAGSTYCCPTNEKVQFECELGYELTGDAQWTCGEDGIWLDAQLPTCEHDKQPVSPSTEPPPLSTGMMHTMIGVAVGILGLLVIVMLLAFCKPRLRDIKRRWRDLREDENELIVNGQRVVLPTYEEATSCPDSGWCDFYNQIHASAPGLNALSSSHLPVSSQTDNVTRPPESNVTSDDVRSSVDFQSGLECGSDSGPNIDTESQDQEGHPSGSVTITEFLRENPLTGPGHYDDITGFEDSFVPVPDVSDQQDFPQATSTTDGLVSDGAVLASSLACASLPKQRDASIGADTLASDITAAEVADTASNSTENIEFDSHPNGGSFPGNGELAEQANVVPSYAAFTPNVSPFTLNQSTATDVHAASRTDQRINQCQDIALQAGSSSV